MTGRNTNSGRGRGGGDGRSHVGKAKPIRGTSYSHSTLRQTGECAALKEHVFDKGKRGSADQARVSWEKIIVYVGTTLGQYAATELRTGKPFIIP